LEFCLIWGSPKQLPWKATIAALAIESNISPRMTSAPASSSLHNTLTSQHANVVSLVIVFVALGFIVLLLRLLAGGGNR
jgi:hypothetical protein